MVAKAIAKWLVSDRHSFCLSKGTIELAYFIFALTFSAAAVASVLDTRLLVYTQQMVGLLTCSQPDGLHKLCLSISLVYRVSAVLGCFHLFMIVVCLFRQRAAMLGNEHCWLLKACVLGGLFVGSCFVPNSTLDYIKHFSWIPGCEFLFYQTVGILETSSFWGKSWSKTYCNGKRWLWWLSLLCSLVVSAAGYLVFSFLREKQPQADWLTWGILLSQGTCVCLNLVFERTPWVFQSLTSGTLTAYLIGSRIQLLWMQTAEFQDVLLNAVVSFGLGLLTLIYWMFLGQGSDHSLMSLLCPCLVKRVQQLSILETEDSYEKVSDNLMDRTKLARKRDLLRKRIEWSKKKLQNLYDINIKKLRQAAIVREEHKLREFSRQARQLDEILSGIYRYRDNYYPRFHLMMATFYLYSGQVGTRWGTMNPNRPTELNPVPPIIQTVHELMLIATCGLHVLTVLNPDFFFERVQRILMRDNYSSDGSEEMVALPPPR